MVLTSATQPCSWMSVVAISVSILDSTSIRLRQPRGRNNAGHDGDRRFACAAPQRRRQPLGCLVKADIIAVIEKAS